MVVKRVLAWKGNKLGGSVLGASPIGFACLKESVHAIILSGTQVNQLKPHGSNP